ncbi:MAG: DMT family transporter [Pseudomonadota bacterium]
MQQPSTQNRPALAIGLKLTAVFFFIVMAAMIKAATQSIPSGQAVFFRSFFALPVIIIWVAQRGEMREALIPQNLMGHVWRGLFGTSAMALTFAALGLLPLPEVTAIGFVTPIFTVILASVLLGETIRVFRLTAVGLGLIGVMIVIWPRLTLGAGDVNNVAFAGAMMVMMASMLRALVQIHIRQLVKTEHTAAIVFYFSLTASALSLLSLPFGWVVPDLWALGLLVGAGLLGGIAQILVTASYRFGSASMLAPFDYASLIFATILGYFLFAEVPTWTMVGGAALVIFGGFIILWRERHLAAERAGAKAVTDPKA